MKSIDLRAQRSNRRIAKMNEANRAEMQKHIKGRPVKNKVITDDEVGSFGELL